MRSRGVIAWTGGAALSVAACSQPPQQVKPDASSQTTVSAREADEVRLVAVTRDIKALPGRLAGASMEEAEVAALSCFSEFRALLSRLSGTAVDDPAFDVESARAFHEALSRRDPELLRSLETGLFEAKLAETKLALDQIGIVVQLFQLEYGRLPTAAEFPRALVEGVDGGTRFLNADGAGLLTDPWGRPLRFSATAGGFEVSSDGPDGEAGTGDDLRVVK